MIFPEFSTSVPVGALTFWMVVLAVKHVVADFVLQNSWMAMGKDARTGWAFPLLVHCAIHGVLTTGLLLVFAPKFWFLGLIDFAIHIVIDRTKGLCVSRFNITMEHQWFWWLIGIDQTLHHLTGFGLSLVLAAN